MRWIVGDRTTVPDRATRNAALPYAVDPRVGADMTIRVFVDGQEGTTGLRIHEYLAQRTDVEVLRAAPELRKDAGERARLLNASDVSFLCLPDAAARKSLAVAVGVGAGDRGVAHP